VTLNERIERHAQHLSQQVSDIVANDPYYEKLALKQAGLDREQFRALGEEAGETEDPRYTLYYATLSDIAKTIMAETMRTYTNYE